MTFQLAQSLPSTNTQFIWFVTTKGHLAQWPPSTITQFNLFVFVTAMGQSTVTRLIWLIWFAVQQSRHQFKAGRQQRCPVCCSSDVDVGLSICSRSSKHFAGKALTICTDELFKKHRIKFEKKNELNLPNLENLPPPCCRRVPRGTRSEPTTLLASK